MLKSVLNGVRRLAMSEPFLKFTDVAEYLADAYADYSRRCKLRNALAVLKSEHSDVATRSQAFEALWANVPWTQLAWEWGRIFVVSQGPSILAVTIVWNEARRHAWSYKDSEVPMYVWQSTIDKGQYGLKVIGCNYLYGEALRKAQRAYRKLTKLDAEAQRRITAQGGPMLERPLHAEMTNRFRNDEAFLKLLSREKPPRLEEGA